MPLLLAAVDRTLFTTSDDGKTLQAADPSLRFLHLLPRLLLTNGQAIQLGRRKARLQVSSDTPGLVVEPEGGVMVRKAYPNKHYLVGGSTATRKGWLVALPAGAEAVRLVMTWGVPLEGGTVPVTLQHGLTLRFKAATEIDVSSVYSMDLATWPRAGRPLAFLGELAPLALSPYVTLGAHGLQGSRKAWVSQDSTLENAVLTEVLDVPAQSLGQFFDLQALGQTAMLV